MPLCGKRILEKFLSVTVSIPFKVTGLVSESVSSRLVSQRLSAAVVAVAAVEVSVRSRHAHGHTYSPSSPTTSEEAQCRRSSDSRVRGERWEESRRRKARRGVEGREERGKE